MSKRRRLLMSFLFSWSASSVVCSTGHRRCLHDPVVSHAFSHPGLHPQHVERLATWEAHSFLCVSPDAVMTRHVQAIAGFGWGFTVADSHVTIPLPEAGPDDWTAILTCSGPTIPSGSSTADTTPPDHHHRRTARLAAGECRSGSSASIAGTSGWPRDFVIDGLIYWKILALMLAESRRLAGRIPHNGKC